MYKSWLEALKTPFWYLQRGAFPIFSKNAVEVEAVPQQVVEQAKKPLISMALYAC